MMSRGRHTVICKLTPYPLTMTIAGIRTDASSWASPPLHERAGDGPVRSSLRSRVGLAQVLLPDSGPPIVVVVIVIVSKLYVGNAQD